MIRTAQNEEYEPVRRLYHHITDALENNEYGPGWKKDIYPDPAMLKEAIAGGQLYVLIDKETFIGAMIVNSEANVAYETFPWKNPWNKDEILVIHALGIHPSFARHGYAREMVRFVLTMASAQEKKAVRLDVLKGNVPAERLYPSLGFVYEGEIPMYYEDTGETVYELYEYTIGNKQRRMDPSSFSDHFDVRLLREEDIPDIYRIALSNPLYYSHCQTTASKEAICEDMAMLPPGKVEAEKYYAGYFQDGKLVAVIDLIDGYPDEHTAYIGLFMVDGALSGNGIGSQIVDDLTRMLPAYGFGAIRLCYIKSNPQASHFWTKTGFVPLKETLHPYGPAVIAEIALKDNGEK